MESSTRDASPPRRRLTIGSAIVLIALVACGLGIYRNHVKNARMWVKSYPVGDLLAPGKVAIKGRRGVNFTPLIASIQSNVSPTSWEGQGGSGKLTPFFLNESLIIRNNERVHREVEAFILRMRKDRQQGRTSQSAP